MAAISEQPIPEKPQPGVVARVVVRQMWVSIAITVMWLVVLFDALWGPNFVSTSAGGNMTSIPSAIVVALFAYLGTKVVAKYGYGDREYKES
jgi:hypothetical protein